MALSGSERYLAGHIAADLDGRQVVVLAANGGGTPAVDTEFDKATAATQSASTIANAIQTALAGQWSAGSAPAAGTVAIASKAAGGAGVRHIITAFDFEAVAAGGAAPATTSVTVTVRDGASGAGTVLKTFNVRFNAQADGSVIARHSVTGIALVGSANTAATVEFSAGGTNVLESCNVHGYSVS